MKKDITVNQKRQRGHQPRFISHPNWIILCVLNKSSVMFVGTKKSLYTFTLSTTTKLLVLSYISHPNRIVLYVLKKSYTSVLFETKKTIGTKFHLPSKWNCTTTSQSKTILTTITILCCCYQRRKTIKTCSDTKIFAVIEATRHFILAKIKLII